MDITALDVPVHGPDLPLWPGNTVYVGMGLWNSILLSTLLDAGVFLAGLAVYVRATRAVDRVGSWGLAIIALVLLGIFLGSTFGPPPSSVRALAISALALWLFVPWTAWIDRHRMLLHSDADRTTTETA